MLVVSSKPLSENEIVRISSIDEKEPRILEMDSDQFSKAAIMKLFTKHKLVLFYGEGELYSEFPSYASQEYPYPYESIDYIAKTVFDLALSSSIPIIGIDWGVSLISCKCGLELRVSSLEENRLVMYKDSIYNIHSSERLSLINRSSSKGYKIVETVQPVVSGYSAVEALYLEHSKILGIKWNPFIDLPFPSSYSLFSQIIKEYLPKLLSTKGLES